MSDRVAVPDGRKDPKGNPVMVLPEGTLLDNCYRAYYLTVGGMSIGYTGIRDDKKYFIKEVESGNTQALISLSQEKATLERLSHPGIIKVKDFFEQNGFCYLVTEFIEGKSLEKYIDPSHDNFINEKLVENWAFQLYDIFEYLHSQNPKIIYRDLKPSNIIEDETGCLHLIDFGIARVHKQNQNIDTYLMGTPYTASPEHFGSRQTDERSDIYTIGATLHFLLTNGLGRKMSTFEFIPLKSINSVVSQKIEKVIEKAIDFNPDNRFQTVREMCVAHQGAGEALYSEIVARNAREMEQKKHPGIENLKYSDVSDKPVKAERNKYIVMIIIIFAVMSGTFTLMFMSAKSKKTVVTNVVPSAVSTSYLPAGASSPSVLQSIEPTDYNYIRIPDEVTNGKGGEISFHNGDVSLEIPSGYIPCDILAKKMRAAESAGFYLKGEAFPQGVTIAFDSLSKSGRLPLMQFVDFFIKEQMGTNLSGFDLKKKSALTRLNDLEFCDLEFMFTGPSGPSPPSFQGGESGGPHKGRGYGFPPPPGNEPPPPHLKLARIMNWQRIFYIKDGVCFVTAVAIEESFNKYRSDFEKIMISIKAKE